MTSAAISLSTHVLDTAAGSPAVDGDGRSLFMRDRDPNGPWKEYERDKRLLVPRAPDETGGEYWRVLPEGKIEGYDGVTIADEPEHEALDFGANFPSNLGTSVSQTAGPYPASERTSPVTLSAAWC